MPNGNKHIIFFLSVALIIGFISLDAHADIDYKKYVILKKMKAAGNEKHGYGAVLLDHWLDGVATGLSWSFSFAEFKKKKPVIACFPPKLAITGEIVYSTIESYLQQHSELMKDETLMGYVAVVAMNEAFPCDEKP